jgi:hypothetical protein
MHCGGLARPPEADKPHPPASGIFDKAASSTGVVRWQGPVVRVQKIIKPCLFILEFEQKILLPKC